MSLKLNYSMSLANSYGLTKTQKIASAIGILGLFILTLALFNVQFPNKTITLTIALSLMFIGTIW
ncbi:MAG: FeS-binding protein, partial [Flavobacteriaceae bacterium]|nr:FeS-binding protein [Flavobacteriaceae bacterium]